MIGSCEFPEKNALAETARKINTEQHNELHEVSTLQQNLTGNFVCLKSSVLDGLLTYVLYIHSVVIYVRDNA